MLTWACQLDAHVALCLCFYFPIITRLNNERLRLRNIISLLGHKTENLSDSDLTAPEHKSETNLSNYNSSCGDLSDSWDVSLKAINVSLTVAEEGKSQRINKVAADSSSGEQGGSDWISIRPIAVKTFYLHWGVVSLCLPLSHCDHLRTEIHSWTLTSSARLIALSFCPRETSRSSSHPAWTSLFSYSYLHLIEMLLPVLLLYVCVCTWCLCKYTTLISLCLAPEAE